MKRYKINYEDGAKHDILGIIDFIENEYSDSFSATKVATRIYQRCESLAVFPKSFPVRRAWNYKKELRVVHARKYAIIYYVDDEAEVVNIRAVINSQRNIEAVLKKRG